MYLATLTRGQTRHYEIRRSVAGQDRSYLDYKVVFNLGNDPRRYIENLWDDVLAAFQRAAENQAKGE